MKIHANARTTLKTRAVLVDQVIRHKKTKAEAARDFGTTPTTVAKWVDRYQREGPYSPMEMTLQSMTEWYLEQITPGSADEPPK